MAASDPQGEEAVVLLVGEDTENRLRKACAEALSGYVRSLPVEELPQSALAQLEGCRVCVGLEAGRRLRQQGWRKGLIFAVTQQEFMRRPIPLGPRDALLFHDVEPARLRAAIRLSVMGLTLFPPGFVPKGEMAGPLLDRFDRLSGKERMILAELALGQSNQEIADRLGCSAETVAQMVTRVLRRLGCTNRTAAAVLAFGRFGPFLDPPETVGGQGRPTPGRP